MYLLGTQEYRHNLCLIYIMTSEKQQNWTNYTIIYFNIEPAVLGVSHTYSPCTEKKEDKSVEGICSRPAYGGVIRCMRVSSVL